MASVHDVAAAVMERDGRPMDTFKLQKLVYYCQAWHLVWEDKRLFPNPIEAWAAGPVVRALYDKHRGEYTVDRWKWGDGSKLSKREHKTVNAVVDSYGKLTGRKLSQLTHNERPWQAARVGLSPTDRSDRQISITSMKAYYAALDADESASPIAELPPDDDL